MAKEPRENEVKFCVFDLMKIASCLRELKARLFLPRTFEVNLRFDVPTGDLKRTGRVLRLRRDKLARLTYKDNSQNIQGALTRREIEFVVDDFESARQFIEALGYQVAFLYEKYRTTYEYKRTHIMLDELPYGNFVEIEGELEMLRPIANELHLDWDKAIPASYYALFERLHRSRGLKFRDLTFANCNGRKVSAQDLSIECADSSTPWSKPGQYKRWIIFSFILIYDI